MSSILVGALTFFIGTAAVFVSQIAMAVEPAPSPIGDELGSRELWAQEEDVLPNPCQLLYGQEKYDRAVVSLTGTAFPGFDTELILDAPGVNCELLPAEVIVPSTGPLAKLRSKLQKHNLEIDLRVTGVARLTFWEGNPKYPLYVITPQDVEVISKPRKFVPRGGA